MAREIQNRQRRHTTDAYTKQIEQQHSAERYVIGCLLLESSAICRVAEILRDDCFADQRLKLVYQAVKDIWNDGQQPDIISVTNRLLQTGDLENAGGAYLISQYASNVGSTTNLEEHAMFIRQCYTSRKLMEAGVTIRSLSMDTSADVGDQVAKAIRIVEDVMNDMDYSNPIRTMAESTDRALAEYEKREQINREGKPWGLRSGIRILDRYLHGFKPGQLIVVGARPGMGKTSLLLHFAKSIAQANERVAIFSLEMNDVSLANRLLLSCTDIDRNAFKDGRLTPQDRNKLIEASGYLRSLPIHIDETPSLSIQQIKVRSMNLKRKSGLSAIMIDYLQLMNMKSENRNYNREQEIANTTKQLKQLAKELDVPVILLSQLNRNIEQKLQGGKKTTSTPMLYDLRESGAIEQDADVVLLIHRPEYYQDTDAIKGIGLINIAKQRDGCTGKVEFAYSEDLTKIGDSPKNGGDPL